MNKRSMCVVVFGVAGLLAACGKGSDAGAGSGTASGSGSAGSGAASGGGSGTASGRAAAPAAGGDDLAKATDLKTQMCACKDVACAKAVEASAEAWGKTMEGKFKDPKDVPAPLMQTMMDMAQCASKVQAAAAPPSDAVDTGDELAKATALKDQMCACTDAECAKKVEVSAEDWGKAMEGKYKDPKAVPPEVMKTMGEMMTCAAKIAGPGAAGGAGAVGDPADLAKANDFKGQMCGCKDAACAKKVTADLEVWGKTLEAKFKDPNNVPKELMTTMMEVAACQAKAQGK
jgi:hypothetical protein